MSVNLHLGDCLDVMRTLPDASVDAVVTDPPYPEISRPYGRMTEAEWAEMMHALVPEVRRVLKPTGSAMFVLQPNSRKVGSIRPWLFEFQAWCCREWNMVQDAYWWNVATLPQACTIKGKLCRPSVKLCVWLGSPDCYRDQSAVLWDESDANKAARLSSRAIRVVHPSGHSVNGHKASAKALEAGGVTPFNLLPIANTNSTNSAGSHGHGAGTPAPLCNWWVRYISPPAGVVLDPFIGTGTVGLEALKLGRSVIGIERDPAYFTIARRRLRQAERARKALSA